MTGRQLLFVFCVVGLMLAIIIVVFSVDLRAHTEAFNGYFGTDLSGRFSLSEDEKAVLRPYVEKRLIEFKEDSLTATSERVKWASEPHPDKTVTEALDTLKGLEITEKAHWQTFNDACGAAIFWRVVEKCD